MMRSVYSTRHARLDELPLLVEMGARMHEESSTYRGMSFSTHKVDMILRAAVKGNPLLFLRVIDCEGVPVGILLGEVHEMFFTTDKVANDVMIFVDIAHRGQCFRQLQEMAGDYKMWARIAGAKVITLASSSGYKPERAQMMLASLGFPCVGSVHAIVNGG